MWSRNEFGSFFMGYFSSEKAEANRRKNHPGSGKYGHATAVTTAKDKDKKKDKEKKK